MKLLKSVKNKIEAEVERVAGDKHCVLCPHCNQQLRDASERMVNWSCNFCRKSYNHKTKYMRYRCDQHDFDCCQTCAKTTVNSNAMVLQHPNNCKICNMQLKNYTAKGNNWKCDQCGQNFGGVCIRQRCIQHDFDLCPTCCKVNFEQKGYQHQQQYQQQQFQQQNFNYPPGYNPNNILYQSQYPSQSQQYQQQSQFNYPPGHPQAQQQQQQQFQQQQQQQQQQFNYPPGHPQQIKQQQQFNSQFPQPGQPGQPGGQAGQPGQPGGQRGQPGQPGGQPGQPGQPGQFGGYTGQQGTKPGQTQTTYNGQPGAYNSLGSSQFNQPPQGPPISYSQLPQKNQLPYQEQQQQSQFMGDKESVKPGLTGVNNNNMEETRRPTGNMNPDEQLAYNQAQQQQQQQTQQPQDNNNAGNFNYPGM